MSDRNSFIWELFSQEGTDKSIAKCLLCSKTLSRGKNDGKAKLGTSNLHRHAQSFHTKRYEELSNAHKQEQEHKAQGMRIYYIKDAIKRRQIYWEQFATFNGWFCWIFFLCRWSKAPQATQAGGCCKCAKADYNGILHKAAAAMADQQYAGFGKKKNHIAQHNLTNDKFKAIANWKLHFMLQLLLFNVVLHNWFFPN